VKTKKILIILTIITILLIGCDRPEFTNLADTDIELTPMSGQLYFSQLTDSSVMLHWLNNNDVIGEYIIERKINDGAYSHYAEVEANTTRFIDTDLLIQNTYFYKVTGANNENQTNSISNSISTNFVAPANIAITQESITSARLTWSHNCSYETGYVIERRNISKSLTENLARSKDIEHLNHKAKFSNREKLKNCKDFQIIVEISANNFNYTDINVIPNQQYEYRLKAISNLNESDYIQEIYDNFFPAPTNLLISQSSITSCELSWQDNSVGEQGFKIDRKDDNAEWQIAYQTVTENEETLVETGLIPTSTYQYRVYAFSDENTSTSITREINMIFPAPTNLLISQSSITSCELSWQDNSVGEQGFKIDRKDDNAEWQIAYQTVAENVETLIETGLIPSSIYQYRVYGFSDENTSTSITGEINMIFPAPTDLQITLTSLTSCQLNWNYSSIGGEDGFKIKRKLSGGTWTEIIQLGINETDFEDTGLTEGETYEYMVYAFKSEYDGNAISETIEFPLSTVTDIDGNIYQVVLIGNQIWMAENLKVTHYRSGDVIPHLTNHGDWVNTNSGAYCVYNNSPGNADTYGNLYNWYAVIDSRNIAPSGWHIPSDNEVKELEMTLGMSQSEANNTDLRGTNEGSKLADRADLWDDGALENDTDFNSSGFRFLPGGFRDLVWADYDKMGIRGYIWTSTQNNIESWYRGLDYDDTRVARFDTDKHHGFSVRCLMD